MNIDDIKFDERGLAPAIVQDARTRRVLMLAYVNRESLQRTIETGETWFWSRSRQELWHKGATSGNTQQVESISADCDGDAVLVSVVPQGPACHTGEESCFFNSLVEKDGLAETDLATTLARLYELIELRRRERPEGSYTTYLFDQGLDKILKKVGEEATETIVSAKNEDRAGLVNEASDLLYHLLVLFVERGVSLSDVNYELVKRGKEARARS